MTALIVMEFVKKIRIPEGLWLGYDEYNGLLGLIHVSFYFNNILRIIWRITWFLMIMCYFIMLMGRVSR